MPYITLSLILETKSEDEVEELSVDFGVAFETWKEYYEYGDTEVSERMYELSIEDAYVDGTSIPLNELDARFHMPDDLEAVLLEKLQEEEY